MNHEKMTGAFSADIQTMDQMLRVGKSFDVIVRDIWIADRKAKLYMIDGFVKDDIMEKVMEFLMDLPADRVREAQDVKTFADRFLPYVETALCGEYRQVCVQVLSGTIALFVEGCDQAIMVDARTYPARGVTEPEAPTTVLWKRW